MFVSVSKVARVAVLGSSECCLRAPVSQMKSACMYGQCTRPNVCHSLFEFHEMRAMGCSLKYISLKKNAIWHFI